MTHFTAIGRLTKRGPVVIATSAVLVAGALAAGITAASASGSADDGTPARGRGDVIVPAAPATVPTTPTTTVAAVPSTPATDDDGTPDQGRGDAPLGGLTAPAPAAAELPRASVVAVAALAVLLVPGLGTAHADDLPTTEMLDTLRDRLLAGLQAIPEVRVNGHLQQRVPHNLNISFQFVEGESLLMGMKGLAVSSGSACTSASLEPSYVLRALGPSDEVAHSSIRFSIGRFTTVEDIDRAVAQVRATVEGILKDIAQRGDAAVRDWAPAAARLGSHEALAPLLALLADNGIADVDGDIWLQTYPRVWGYTCDDGRPRSSAFSVCTVSRSTRSRRRRSGPWRRKVRRVG